MSLLFCGVKVVKKRHFSAFRVGNRPGGCPFGRRKWAEWPAVLAYAGALSIFVPARRFPGPVAAAGNEKGIPCESVTIPVAVCSGPAASKLRGIGRPLCATGSAESGRRRSWSESEDLPPCLCELCFYGEWKDSAAADLPPPSVSMVSPFAGSSLRCSAWSECREVLFHARAERDDGPFRST